MSMTLFLSFSKGPEAKKVYNEAQSQLQNMINKKSLKAHGVIAFYPANSVGDDIEVYDDDGKVIAVLHGLRQQVSTVIPVTLNW